MRVRKGDANALDVHLARDFEHNVAHLQRGAIAADHGYIVGEFGEYGGAGCGGCVGVGGDEAGVDCEIAIVGANALHAPVENGGRHADGGVGWGAVELLELLYAQLLVVELVDAHFVVAHDL